MTDEQWLREGLADAVPEPPANPDRARSAERLARRRRRTTTLAVLGTAGAVAAVSVLGVTLLSGDDDPDSANDPTSEAPAFVVECPPIEVDKGGFAQGSELDQPDPGAADAVPQDATSARLCQGPGSAIDVPDEALVRGVDDLVAAVNGLVVAPEDQFCTQELGPGFRIAFGYDDRSTFVVSGQLYGCRTVVVGSTYRNGADAARAAVLDLLADQRQAEGGSSENGAPSAPTCSYDEPAQPADYEVAFTAAVLCIDDGNGTQLSSEIDAADLELLVADMKTNQTDGVLRCGVEPPWPTIVGTDDTGTAIAIPSECGTAFWRLPNGRAWAPSKDAVAILDGLVEAAQ
ncbi:hypothetical protein DJ010_03275 [Nocardioides silvaticus]|uniref:Uncharacterized protein n=1 Tax=Nocardioides silvaticus TaxID=2201891 RepID=A0A316TY23_9ACTN|nr:hypothetical protein [Nocardioides silvaticus]PWN04656.1 hypothetical protein DJ010_03275 [Nocardioides silvaticus]